MSHAIGADLGRLASPPRGGRWDDVRLALVDALVTANGEGRLDHAAWLESFASAARSLRVRVIAEAEQQVRGAARSSRYPSRKLAQALPDADAADALLNRLLAAAIPLERLETLSDDAVSQRARAAAIDTAWEAATAIAQGELTRWRAVAARVSAWSPPVARFWVASGAAVVAALVCSAWLGGQLTAPQWFRPVTAFWWRLWP